MALSTRFPWPRVSTGLEILSPMMLIVLGHPWLGVATLGGVLASATLQSWIVIRSAQEWHRAVLSYAQDTTSVGGDPSGVIAALHGMPGDVEPGAPLPRLSDEPASAPIGPSWPLPPPRA